LRRRLLLTADPARRKAPGACPAGPPKGPRRGPPRVIFQVPNPGDRRTMFNVKHLSPAPRRARPSTDVIHSIGQGLAQGRDVRLPPASATGAEATSWRHRGRSQTLEKYRARTRRSASGRLSLSVGRVSQAFPRAAPDCVPAPCAEIMRISHPACAHYP